MTGKIGVQTLPGFSDWDAVIDLYRRTQAPVFKTMSFPLDQLKRLHVVSPGTLIVGRIYDGGWDSRGIYKDPEHYAESYVAGVWSETVDALAAAGILPYFAAEGLNERNPHGEKDLGAYARFEIRRAEALAGKGCAAVVGCFGTGNPEPAEFKYFYPAIRAALEHDGLVETHEYSAPEVSFGFGKNQLNPAEDAGPYGWLTGRYRMFLRDMPADLRAALKGRWVIGEGVVDGNVTNRPPGPGAFGGYNDKPMVDWLREKCGEPDPYAWYLKQIKWYQELVAQDDEILGVALYQFGPCGTWQSFDVSPMREQLAAYLENLNDDDEEEEPVALAQGVDVSKYQVDVDWQKMKADGKSFAFIRSGYGLDPVDPTFAANWRNAKAAGVLRGAYHFFRPQMDARAQAEAFVARFGGDYGELPPVLDLEEGGGLIGSAVLAAAKNFLDVVEELTGVKPILYTAAWCWDPWVISAGVPAWLGDYPLWVANYTVAAGPRIPRGFTKWTFWQFNNKGAAGGESPLDLNRFAGTEAELLAWAAAYPRSGGELERLRRQLALLQHELADANAAIGALESKIGDKNAALKNIAATATAEAAR